MKKIMAVFLVVFSFAILCRVAISNVLGSFFSTASDSEVTYDYNLNYDDDDDFFDDYDLNYEYYSNLYSNNDTIATINNDYIHDTEDLLYSSNTLSGYIFFSGVKTIWEIDSEKDQDVSLSYNLSMDGDFKIILVDSNNEVTEIEDNYNIDTATLHLTEGTNFLKIVGLEATGDISLKFHNNNTFTVKEFVDGTGSDTSTNDSLSTGNVDDLDVVEDLNDI